MAVELLRRVLFCGLEEQPYFSDIFCVFFVHAVSHIRSEALAYNEVTYEAVFAFRNTAGTKCLFLSSCLFIFLDGFYG